ncbi:protein of unknown function [Candidatus Hydrogenisulfobacillus filiaventi]|uniref:Uncharacterized protein n=1 Tax=Candidatus Hydrogenisulfobacillus filiaventi TaxID=2707344 RepID=A0A6F8ZIM1_9FIRM|nr:protein of unknown function [Candidatus Hydrogenisulfobacillus filiaventi]
MAGRGIPDHRRGLTAIGAVLLAAAALAGCGAPQALRHPLRAIQRAQAGLPRYAVDGTPVNRAALEARYGKIFPGLVLRAPGAPKTPPFSLAAYPANHAVRWALGPATSAVPPSPSGAAAAPPSSLTPAEVTAATTAADWIIATNDNHPLTAWRYLDPDARVSAGTVRSGIPDLGALQAWNLGSELHQFRGLVPGTHTPGGGYEYRTWAVVSAVEPLRQWLSGINQQMGTYGPTPTLPDLPGFLPQGQRATAAYVVVVTSYNIFAGGGSHHDRGDYGYGGNGPTPVLVADVAGQGWRVVGFGNSPGFMIRWFPEHYAVPKG